MLGAYTSTLFFMKAQLPVWPHLGRKPSLLREIARRQITSPRPTGPWLGKGLLKDSIEKRARLSRTKSTFALENVVIIVTKSPTGVGFVSNEQRV